MNALLRVAKYFRAISVSGAFTVSLVWFADALTGSGAPVWRHVIYAAATGALAALTAMSFALKKQIAGHRRLARRYIKLLTAINRLPYGVIVFSRKARLEMANQAYCELYGIDSADLPPGMEEEELRNMRRNMGLPVKENAQYVRIESAAKGQQVRIKIWPLADGRMIQFEKIDLEDGSWIALHRDITAQVRQSQKLDETSRFLNSVLDHVPSAILVKDARTLRYEFLNRAAERFNGWRAQDVVGRASAELFPADQARRIDQRDQAAFATADGEVLGTEERVVSAHGLPRVQVARRLLVRDANGDPSRLIIVLEDLTAQREAEERTAFLAMHDALTGLHNRAWFNDKLDSLANDNRSGGEFALAVMDLDSFKDVNDTFGHVAGDLILKHVAGKIAGVMGSQAQAARLGGDEFALFVEVDPSPEATVAKMRALIEAVSEPIIYEESRISVRCSIGLAFSARGAIDPEELYREADIALYEAKTSGKAAVRVFDEEIARKRLQMKTVEYALREAIRAGQFDLQYQPIFDARNREIVSMEALLHWNHPERGVMAASEFMAAAESSRLILPVGELAIRKACEAALGWPERIRVSINLSLAQFRDLDLASKISRILAQTGLQPARLELEIPEAALLSGDSTGLAALNALRATGVRLVMDEFGASPSSLNYIRNFPFDKIKIDKSLVTDLSCGPGKSNIVLRAVLSMARVLDLATTAEGVETAGQALQLFNEGCTELQGGFLGEPLPEAEAAALFGPGSIRRIPA